MASTASLLDSEGGSDLALGAGNPTQGGEDLTIFIDVIMRKNRLVYEPASLADEHRRADISLQKQIHHYETALTAYLTKIIPSTLYSLRLYSQFFHSLLFILTR